MAEIPPDVLLSLMQDVTQRNNDGPLVMTQLDLNESYAWLANEAWTAGAGDLEAQRALNAELRAQIRRYNDLPELRRNPQ